ncbi:uncharacterized protein LOC104893560 [Beta vulgaris subsp. vulgaris]|uniref:uncharacterized protein LOC104893560 n=1 Tax=Beta vulgaris subsp. vulgaris TaxID=3555 RepID=UPI002036A724|nr:uncharacterized protein LOC104893560 [Beta vulgaris subsp. vulgaris]
MALTINKPIGGATLFNKYTTITTTTTLSNTQLSIQFFRSPLSLSSRTTTTTTTTFIASATGKFSSRTGKFDSKNRRNSSTTTKDEDKKNVMIGDFENNGDDVIEGVDDGYFLPDLPGLQTDFWEGPQWDTFGFVVQYLWAFGIVFALIACGIAVATFNEGATDFRETPAFKESIQSQDLLEGPEASDTDVFESNPTEEAPALE